MATDTATTTSQRIMELHRQGKSQNAICQELGLNKGFVNTAIRILEENPPQASSSTVRIVPFDQVLANPWQPRKTMNPDALQRFAEDIAEKGLLQNPLGRPHPDPSHADDGAVQLAFGHRRLAAVKILAERGQWDLAGIPVKVETITDAQMFLIALSENSVREQVDPVEELEAIQAALESIEGLTIAELARQRGVDRSTLSNQLRCLKLPAVVLDVVRSGDMTLAGAREFLCLMNDNHCHLEDMQYVIDYIADTPNWPGTNDWRPKNVRRVIRRRVCTHEYHWRPLEAAEGDVDYQVISSTQGQSAHFEIAQIPDTHVHRIPRIDAGSRKWTCDAKLWQRLEQAAQDARKPDPKPSGPLTQADPPDADEPSVSQETAENAVPASPGSPETAPGESHDLLNQKLGIWPEIWDLTVRQAQLIRKALIFAVEPHQFLSDVKGYGFPTEDRAIIHQVIDILDGALAQKEMDLELEEEG